MGRIEEAYNTIYDAIIKYEDIEDMRIEHGDMRATIDYVEEWTYQLDIIQERVHYKKSILTDFVLPSKFIYYGKKLILDFL